MRRLPQGARRSFVADFFPGYFGLVMATGIVSIALRSAEWYLFSNLLFGINVVSFCVLWGITILRLGRHRVAFVRDLTHHARGVTFLTMVAGTSVLGIQFALMTPWIILAKVLWVVAGFLWLFLIYTFFGAITVADPKPSLETTVNGSWLLVTVSVESLAVLGTYVASGPYLNFILFISVCAYSLGGMFYISFITLILHRWIFAKIGPAALGPSEWIDMGALAITTLAGARLLLLASRWTFLGNLSPFLRGLTLFFWVTGTWWIPLLIIIEIWRHIEGVPMVYSPQYRTLVFPVGMYTVATGALTKATGITMLALVPKITVYAAFIAWILTFVGLLRKLLKLSSSPV
ncbi:MAG TPA: tellurite resistance/C4-dicarboxylate transporter family protein [Chthoniobacterales bacterium]